MFKFLVAAALAVAPASAPPSLTPAEQAQLQDNLHRGELLYRYDQAAWHTSDAMFEHVPEAQRFMVRGWVVTSGEKADKATYFGLDDAKPFLIYSATWDGRIVGDESIPVPDEKRPLEGEELRLAKAEITAFPVSAELGRCSDKPFNVVVLPGTYPADPVSVYFLTPQTENELYPFGGHYRIDVKDGKVVGQREFTKTCVNLSTKSENGERPIALGISHLLDAIPTEIHVFEMFATKIPIVVIVPNGRPYTLYADNGLAQVKIDKVGD